MRDNVEGYDYVNGILIIIFALLTPSTARAYKMLLSFKYRWQFFWHFILLTCHIWFCFLWWKLNIGIIFWLDIYGRQLSFSSFQFEVNFCIVRKLCLLKIVKKIKILTLTTSSEYVPSLVLIPLGIEIKWRLNMAFGHL